MDVQEMLGTMPAFGQAALRTIAQKRPDITLEQVIMLPRAEVQGLTNLSQQNITKLISLISADICKNCDVLTVADMHANHASRLSLGDSIIDNLLRGGIPPFGITEVTGESSSGKTQLCLQLLLQAQLPLEMGGLNGSAVYLCTEGEVPIKRLKQMAESWQSRCRIGYDCTHTPEKLAEDFCSNIFVEKVPHLDALWNIISARISQLINNERPLKLIVIDSIAALFRSEFCKDDAVARTKILWEYASQLKQISSKYSVAIIAVNQVTDVISAPAAGAPVHANSHLQRVHYASVSKDTSPALGLAWANFINTRVVLSRTPFSFPTKRKAEALSPTDGSTGPAVVRKMKVGLSSSVPEDECFFIVNNGGVQGVETKSFML